MPLVGTWIEMRRICAGVCTLYHVVPLVGTWIEIATITTTRATHNVVPLVGTWIEMFGTGVLHSAPESCPSWARGLKSTRSYRVQMSAVVPLVGTWIEIR